MSPEQPAAVAPRSGRVIAAEVRGQVAALPTCRKSGAQNLEGENWPDLPAIPCRWLGPSGRRAGRGRRVVTVTFAMSSAVEPRRPAGAGLAPVRAVAGYRVEIRTGDLPAGVTFTDPGWIRACAHGSGGQACRWRLAAGTWRRRFPGGHLGAASALAARRRTRAAPRTRVGFRGGENPRISRADNELHECNLNNRERGDVLACCPAGARRQAQQAE